MVDFLSLKILVGSLCFCQITILTISRFEMSTIVMVVHYNVPIVVYRASDRNRTGDLPFTRRTLYQHELQRRTTIVVCLSGFYCIHMVLCLSNLFHAAFWREF